MKKIFDDNLLNYYCNKYLLTSYLNSYLNSNLINFLEIHYFNKI